MKQLDNGKGRRVHPTPLTGAAATRDLLAALPATVLALAATLTAAEQEVLAYLLSGGGGGGRWRERRRRRRAHPPELGCGCFGCYKSFWARWDASPNRHVIHRIIDIVEESSEARELDRGSGSSRRRRSGRGERKDAGLAAEVAATGVEERLGVVGMGFSRLGGGRLADDDGEDGDDDGEELNGGGNSNNDANGGCNSVRRFMSFIGERVWGAWN
ncbi:hypothetical protein OPV22_028396 [Ensete ventricosum]|uniref:Uncharacterized protein n=1 Tax=Ensete ventricosum TaxID=4639 RepID=A0AAV8Q3J5_ENSVE|nr:hypothetical protein OPV22_028396 [Ensete ventricosum]RWW18260.1 hypothetical protein GW17_00017763 [Ensete ventricosum]RZR91894.1 hypothetical protein BHM03_00020085 [Ensete ventricosum]